MINQYSNHTVLCGIYVLLLRLSLKYSSASNVQNIAINQTLTLAYALPWNQEWLVGRKMGSAVILGLEEVERRGLLPGYTIEWVWRDTYCQSKRGMQMALDMWESVHDLDAIIGDGCSIVCQPISLLAAAWGIPVISWGCTSASLSNKHVYPTFTRVHGTWVSLGPVFNQLAAMFNWSKVAIITTPEDLWILTSQAIKNVMEKDNKTVVYHLIQSTHMGGTIIPEKMQALQQTISELKNQVWIFYLMTYASDIRNILIAALDEGMLNGKYAFVTIETLIMLDVEHSYRPEVGPHIYNGLLGVGVRTPSGPLYQHFLQRVIDAFQYPVFKDQPHLPADAHIEDVHVYAG